MPLADLDERTRDTIARNSLGAGKYILVSFPGPDTEPVVIQRGMSVRRYNLAIHEVRQALFQLQKEVKPHEKV